MDDNPKILVTGDRNWTNRSVIYDVLYSFSCHRLGYILQNGGLTVVHGAASGADDIAGWAVRDLGYWYNVMEDPHPANWTRYGRAAGPIRNGEMLLELSPQEDIVLAFHNDILDSSGTRNCVEGAIRRKILVILHQEYPRLRTFIRPSVVKVPPNQVLRQVVEEGLWYPF